MTYDIKIISLLTLLHAHGLGRIKIMKLLQEFGTPQKVIEAGWDPQKRLLFEKWKVSFWEKDLEIAEKAGVQLITFLDEKYPKNLYAISDFPLLLYVKGSLLPSDAISLAIIGTRNATLYGKQTAEKIAIEISSAGICVVSGLARGIDTAAHEGALKGGGRTLAVIGSGLAQIYPRENCALATKIANRGAVISEFPMAMAPTKGLFPRRNRIVSGLVQGVCLIESPLEGGGMITMHIAEEQKKLLFALPGRVDFPTFAGNHILIKQKKANLVENGSDLLKYLNITQGQEVKTIKSPLLTSEELSFLEKIPAQEKSIEELVLLTQLPIMQLNVLLTRLVLKKVMKEFPGKLYKKIG